jgi:hypothetical protein
MMTVAEPEASNACSGWPRHDAMFYRRACSSGPACDESPRLGTFSRPIRVTLSDLIGLPRLRASDFPRITDDDPLAFMRRQRV